MTKLEVKVKKNNKKGSALAYALVIIAIVMIILVSMLGYVVSQLKFSFNRAEREKAFQIAEAGAYYYRWYLAYETSGKTPLDLENFWQGGTALGTSVPYPEIDYGGIGKYKLEVTAPQPGSTIVIVKSTGWTYKEPNTKRIVQVRFRRPSWSEYVMLSESFINVGSQAEIYGKMHSNTGIRFDGKAYNVISSLPYSFDDPSHGSHSLEFGVHTHDTPTDPLAPDYPWPEGTVPDRADVFTAGREFPVPEVSFSGVSSSFTTMESAANGGHGQYFDSTGFGRRIILKTNGTFDICTVNSYQSGSFAISSHNGYKKSSGSGTCDTCSGQCLSNYSIPDNGVIYVNDNIWVEGTINDKRVTIAAGGSQSDIYIGMNNIRYTNYDGSDIIGLAARRDITVIKDCPDNFIVDAALIAQSGQVGICQNFTSKNSITLNGALASFLQPFMVHGSSGFGERTYNFDNNLLYFPPPYFPTGTEYSIDLWEEL
ncbi:MAG: pilus assembly PilX N-terminal domain-containing protein [Patescibacteria group bacterium]